MADVEVLGNRRSLGQLAIEEQRCVGTVNEAM